MDEHDGHFGWDLRNVWPAGEGKREGTEQKESQQQGREELHPDTSPLQMPMQSWRASKGRQPPKGDTTHQRGVLQMPLPCWQQTFNGDHPEALSRHR